MSLKEWFGKGPKGDWVDIGAPKKDGKFQACGRSSTSDSKRGYPKCVPRAKAKSMTSEQKKSAVSRKRAKPQGVGGKPTNVATIAKGKKMYGKDKKKMAYGGMTSQNSMQQNPQKSLMDMNRSGSMVAPSMATGSKVAKMYSRGGGVRKVNY